MPRIISDYKGQAKARIAQAALDEFSRRGYRNVTMEEIAKDVGVTKADLYHYFPSKAALLQEIGSRFQEAFVRSLVESLEKVDSLDSLTNAFERLLDTQESQSRLWFDLLSESSSDPEVENSIKEVNRESIKAMKRALSNLAKSTKNREERVSISDDAAMSIMFLLSGAQTNAKLGISKKDIRGALREGLRGIFLR